MNNSARIASVFALIGAIIAWNVGCAASSRVEYSPPRRATRVNQYRNDLTSGQVDVIESVLHADKRFYNGTNKEDLFFALPKGILVLFFGDHGYPSGSIPPGEADCPKSEADGCRIGASVLGSNQIYYPARGGGPGVYAGILMSSGPHDLDSMDWLTRYAYRKYHVPAPWDRPWGFWSQP
jgi:hypothetical protein